MQKKILLPLTTNKSDQTSITVAKNFAEKLKSEIILMYVAADNGDIPSSKGSYIEKVKNEIEGSKIKTGGSILTKGDEIDEIIRVLKEMSVDLVVMAANTDGEDNTLRKTNLKLIRKTEIPVYEVKPHSEAEIKKILCPVDLSDNSERALNNAVGLARLFNAELHVLSIFEPLHSTSEFIKAGDSELFNEHKELFDSFLDKTDFSNVEWRSKIRRGKPVKEILSEEKEINANLIIMGSSGKSGISRKLVGSVTEGIINNMPCSVIALRSKDLV